MRITSLKNAIEAPKHGGKASALAQLTKAGFVVPPGFVVTMEVDATNDLLKAFDELNSEFVAVRSSALTEDGAKTSWAGQLETYLNISRSGLVEAVTKCQLSAASERAIAYANENNVEAGAVAVLVQAMIQSEVSGVAFSVHPVTQDTNQMVIEAVFGLGEALVSGEVTPDTYIVNKSDVSKQECFVSAQAKQLLKTASGDTAWQLVRNTGRKLSAVRIAEVAEITIKLENHFGYAVDVEWAFAKDQLYILQARPITTLS